MSQPPEPSTVDLLSRAIQGFLQDRRARGCSVRTVEFYRFELQHLLGHLQAQGIREVLAITPNHLRGYLVHLATHRKPGGVHAAYRAFKALLRWYEAEHEPPGWRNPLQKLAAPKRPRELLKPVAVEQVMAMLDTCQAGEFHGDRDRALLFCLLDTGCRASEFLGLNIGDVDLGMGDVLIQKGKGGKARLVFLCPRSRALLTTYLSHRPAAPPGEPLWVTTEGTRLRVSGLREILRRRARRAWIPTPSAHSFRRAFAISSLRAGMDVYSLQRMMGHSDLVVLRRYLDQVPDDLRRAHDQHGPMTLPGLRGRSAA